MDWEDHQRLERRKAFVRKRIKETLYRQSPMTYRDIQLVIGPRVTDEELQVGMNDLHVKGQIISEQREDGSTVYNLPVSVRPPYPR